jgi:hypothetical protein
MLLESGRSYLWDGCLARKNVANPRIRALSLGRGVERALKTLLKLVKSECLDEFTCSLSRQARDVISRTYSILESFPAEKCFDLYAQSPWVAGSVMSAITDLSLYCGLELLNEGGYFSCVLHMYNMLRQLKVDMPWIPILEQLVIRFTQPVFAGVQRPEKNFHKIFALSRGAFVHHDKVAKATGLGHLAKTPKKDMTTVFASHRNITLQSMSTCAETSFFKTTCAVPDFLRSTHWPRRAH